MDVVINSIYSQCICISKHHVVPFKYLTILFVNCTLIKMKKPKFTPVEIIVKESNKFFVRQTFLALTNFILKCLMII